MFIIKMNSELKNGIYENLNNEILCELKTENEVNEQLEIYAKNDSIDNMHILYDVLKDVTSDTGARREDLAKDYYNYCTIYDENNNELYTPDPTGFFDDYARQKLKEYKKVIKKLKNTDKIYYLIKQFES